MFQESLVLKLKKGEKIITFLLIALSNIFLGGWGGGELVGCVGGEAGEPQFLRPILGRRSLLVGQRAERLCTCTSNVDVFIYLFMYGILCVYLCQRAWTVIVYYII